MSNFMSKSAMFACHIQKTQYSKASYIIENSFTSSIFIIGTIMASATIILSNALHAIGNIHVLADSLACPIFRSSMSSDDLCSPFSYVSSSLYYLMSEIMLVLFEIISLISSVFFFCFLMKNSI